MAERRLRGPKSLMSPIIKRQKGPAQLTLSMVNHLLLPILMRCTSSLIIQRTCRRKQELRELKMLQKQEQKQFQDLAFKSNLAKDQQDKKFEQEKVALI
ncbi:unnamed protein product, partial [Nesidiocoris tenuis]